MHRWKGNIKVGMKWIRLAQDKVQWLVIVNMRAPPRRRGIYSLAELLSASQEGLCSMEPSLNSCVMSSVEAERILYIVRVSCVKCMYVPVCGITSWRESVSVSFCWLVQGLRLLRFFGWYIPVAIVTRVCT
jgi:hypothetical protein